MKTSFIYTVLFCTLLSACQNSSTTAKKEEEEKNGEKQNDEALYKVSARDYSITKNNSYSDLFLDSSAMEKFLAAKKLDDKTTSRLRSFYNTRNYQFAWFTSKGLTEQARAFWNLHDYVTTYDNDTSLRDKSLQKRMDALTAEEELSPTASGDYVQTELALTQHFMQYVSHNYEKGYVKRKEAERFVPYKKGEALAIADSLLSKKHKDNKYFEDINPAYGALKKELEHYYGIVKSGGWPQVPALKTAKLGTSAPAVAVIKKRLHISGELPSADTSQVFTDTLEAAVKTFQKGLGYTQTGVVTAQLIKDMNVPAESRLQQILVNMDRMRWMPTETSGSLIVVNIPEFILHVYEGKQKAFDMNVVVGKEGHNTVSFNGDLSTIVFSPYWNVPSSIVRKEILPKMSKAYLANQEMEVVGTEDGLPKIRQKPGDKNSLGHVKFLFPNSFNIYFHDTPAKSLFSQDKRAYSHGCIRLAEPEKMAQYLLRDQPQWTLDSIQAAMHKDKEQYVKLAKAVPVLITYHTAWVDDSGVLNFRDDIYSHDADLIGKMFL